MGNVLGITAPLFSIIGLGYLLFRISILPAATADGLNKIVMIVCIPAVVVSSFLTQPTTGYLMPGVFLFLTIASICNFALAFVVHTFMRDSSHFRRDLDTTIFSLGSSASTAIFIGFPIIYITHPENAVRLMVHFALVQYLIVFPLGVALCEYFQAKRDAKDTTFVRLCGLALGRTLKNPIIIAIGAGYIGTYVGVPVPEVFVSFVDQLAKGAGMLALLAVGGSLAKREERASDTCALCFMSSFKLIVHPLLVLAYGGIFLSDSPEILIPLVILSAAPVITFFPAIAGCYGLERIASSGLLASYALSFFTINGFMTLLL